MTLWTRRIVTSVLFALMPVAVSAIYVMVETNKVPVARLAENIERQLQQKPDDIDLRLNLARLYAMAYALKVTEFEAQPQKDGSLQAWFGNNPPNMPGAAKPALTREAEERGRKDLERAVTVYRDVVKRAPDNVIAHLGLGWAYEQGRQVHEAVAEYRRVVELAWPRDEKEKYVWKTPATVEAASRLQVLLDPVKDAAELKALKAKTSELETRGRMITPIAIPLGGDTSVPPLDHTARVRFDADGSGIPRDWTWIQEDAGWLVYDAEGKGQITSALQWFGSVTFWLFWNNGYEALAALDDDDDGQLRGYELRNLAIWHDRNQNGISEKGEVRSLAAHGIIALSTRYETGDGITVAAHSPRGVVFANGTSRPSIDIILRSAPSRRSLTDSTH